VKDPVKVHIHSPLQKTATVDTTYTPRASLLQYVDGSRWEVTYYSQVLGADSEPGPWQLNRSPTDQQYAKITQFELLVTSPLSQQEEEPGRSFTVTGTATIVPTMKVNVGDMFTADAGDGREALFAITQAGRKTYLKDSVFEVEYQLVDYIDNRAEVKADLDRKSIRRLVYMKEFLTWGENPMVLEGTYEDLLDLQRMEKEILNFYLRDFYSLQHRTLIIPGQQLSAYDPFIVRMILDMVPAEDHPLIQTIASPVVKANRNSGSYTVLDAVLNGSASYMQMGVQFMRLMSTSFFKGRPDISSIYYTGIKLVACPLDNRTDVDVDYEGSFNPCSCSAQESLVGGVTYGTTGTRWKDLSRYIQSTNLDGFFIPPTDAQMPSIVPVTVDEYYIFSEPFYTRRGAFNSKLEVLAKQLIDEEAIDTVTLVQLAKECHRWPNLERFYYVPILLALIKVALRTN